MREVRAETRIPLSGCIAPCYYAAHRDIASRGHSVYWFAGGRGSAKSSFVSIELILGLLRDPSVNAIVYRKVAATLRESVYGQLLWAVERLGLGAYFRAKLAPLELEYLPTGQRILFRGADDPGKSKSIKLARGRFGFLWFEELAEFAGMDDIRTIAASVLRGAGHTVTFASYNPPESPRSWVNREALAADPKRFTHRSTYLDLPREWLGESFLAEAETLRMQNGRAYRHMYLGEVTGTGGEVFGNVTLRPLTEAELALEPAYCGVDFGFANDPDAFVRAAYERRTGRLYVLDEFFGRHITAERLAAGILERAGRSVVRCDCADPRLIAQLRALGVTAVAAKKGAGSVAGGVRWLTERAEIVVDPKRCPNTARELTEYAYTPDRNGGWLPELPGRDNHSIDALRYALEPAREGNAARTIV